MIDKITFRIMEKRLVDYFKKDKIISSLQHKVDVLNNQIKEIDNKLKNIDISIPEESTSISFEQKVQTSKDGSSYAERTVMKITENLKREKFRKIEEVGELEEQIRKFIADNIIINDNIMDLRVADYKFLETKYGKKLPDYIITDWAVGQQLNMAQSQATRKKRGLVESVANWEEWQKKVD